MIFFFFMMTLKIFEEIFYVRNVKKIDIYFINSAIIQNYDNISIIFCNFLEKFSKVYSLQDD